MPTLPQLIEEDIKVFDRALRDLLARSEATTALIIDKGGFLITTSGETEDFDVTTIAALASGAYLANQTIANLVHEENFNSVYQQGEKFSMLVVNVDEHCLLVVVFNARHSAGAVKYYACATIRLIAAQIQRARARNPDKGLDLSLLNAADTAPFFQRKDPP